MNEWIASEPRLAQRSLELASLGASLGPDEEEEWFEIEPAPIEVPEEIEIPA